MTSTLSVPVEITAVVHEIKGGGYWAEVPCFPGCIAQAETLETLQENIRLAIDDWLTVPPVKTEEEDRRLAAIQGNGVTPDRSFAQHYAYLPPSSWEDDE